MLVTDEPLAQDTVQLELFWLILVLFDTHHMELITRTDYSALDIIAMILKTYKDNFPALSEEENALWAIRMIEHEVEQTGRTLWQLAQGELRNTAISCHTELVQHTLLNISCPSTLKTVTPTVKSI